ncbi:hypothetical protein LTR66_011071 [Elasticomyces elasticus]|nr:hypothetical protein LTR66_011071 [Elasticomyces elasticus]
MQDCEKSLRETAGVEMGKFHESPVVLENTLSQAVLPNHDTNEAKTAIEKISNRVVHIGEQLTGYMHEGETRVGNIIKSLELLKLQQEGTAQTTKGISVLCAAIKSDVDNYVKAHAEKAVPRFNENTNHKNTFRPGAIVPELHYDFRTARQPTMAQERPKSLMVARRTTCKSQIHSAGSKRKPTMPEVRQDHKRRTLDASRPDFIDHSLQPLTPSRDNRGSGSEHACPSFSDNEPGEVTTTAAPDSALAQDANQSRKSESERPLQLLSSCDASGDIEMVDSDMDDPQRDARQQAQNRDRTSGRDGQDYTTPTIATAPFSGISSCEVYNTSARTRSKTSEFLISRRPGHTFNRIPTAGGTAGRAKRLGGYVLNNANCTSFHTIGPYHASNNGLAENSLVKITSTNVSHHEQSRSGNREFNDRGLSSCECDACLEKHLRLKTTYEVAEDKSRDGSASETKEVSSTQRLDDVSLNRDFASDADTSQRQSSRRASAARSGYGDIESSATNRKFAHPPGDDPYQTLADLSTRPGHKDSKKLVAFNALTIDDVNGHLNVESTTTSVGLAHEPKGSPQLGASNPYVVFTLASSTKRSGTTDMSIDQN